MGLWTKTHAITILPAFVVFTVLAIVIAKLALNDGSTFGDEGIGYMRMNLGCPRSVIEKALSQLKEAVNKKVCIEVV